MDSLFQQTNSQTKEQKHLIARENIKDDMGRLHLLTLNYLKKHFAKLEYSPTITSRVLYKTSHDFPSSG